MGYEGRHILYYLIISQVHRIVNIFLKHDDCSKQTILAAACNIQTKKKS